MAVVDPPIYQPYLIIAAIVLYPFVTFAIALLINRKVGNKRMLRMYALVGWFAGLFTMMLFPQIISISKYWYTNASFAFFLLLAFAATFALVCSLVALLREARNTNTQVAE